MVYTVADQNKRKLLCFIFGFGYFFLYVRRQSHLSTRGGSVLVPPPVELLQHILVRHRMRVDGPARQSHTHHQDLLTVRRLAQNKSIILQVHHHRHQCSATAATPAPPLPQQSGSQQSRAHCEGGGGAERRRGWTAGDSRGPQNRTVWTNH